MLSLNKKSKTIDFIPLIQKMNTLKKGPESPVFVAFAGFGPVFLCRFNSRIPFVHTAHGSYEFPLWSSRCYR